ncbi:MAG: type IV secretion system DNA-binding domain-containing protein [bacterium]|nr:type IV secretion system DNA-binding domain-containing protein [bacterium]
MYEFITPFAKVDFRRDHRVFGMKKKDRRFHLLTIGRTGAGKSNLMATLIKGDLEHAEGVAVLDPHGDLAAVAEQFVPTWRKKEMMVFRPGDPENQLTFNPLHVPRPDQRHLVVSELITVFKKIWGDSWGPRLEYILRIVLLTLTERPGQTLLDALRMLNDSDFRSSIVDQIEDPILKRFWTDEYTQYSKGYRTEAIAPIQNKLGEFLINPVLRRVFEHPEGDIHPRAIMDNSQIFIADLSVGRIGRDISMLLGATLIGKFALAALSRSDQRPDKRRDFYCYVDEFPMFTTASIDIILSEARKYGLALILAMQYLDQLDTQLLGAVLGNVGNLVVFRVGAQDAAVLGRELAPVFSGEDLMDLPYYHAYIRMMIDGKPAKPFSARLLEVPSPPKSS